MNRLWRLLTSLKTTAVLLGLLASLLLLNIVLPQKAVIGEEAFAALVAEPGPARFFLVDLGLGSVVTSPLFKLVVWLFYASLTAVLVTWARPIWYRTRYRPRSEHAVHNWAEREEGLSAPLPPGWGLGELLRTLKGFGYQARKVGDGVVWGVKHRTAPLGFLLFHLSFFLLPAGGLLLYATRFVGSASLIEGQTFSGDYGQVVRRPRTGHTPELRFTLERVEARFQEGEPVHLEAVFRFHAAGVTVERRSRINAPAHWGSAMVLVQQAGVAPILWLQDDRGFTLDRVAVTAATRRESGTRVALGPPDLQGGRLEVVILPLAPEVPFPSRQELASLPVTLRLLDGGEPGFERTLRPGEWVTVGDRRLVLEEVRLWVGFQVVAERGGSLLITGFLVAVAGLVWRLLIYRREVAVLWDGVSFQLLGRSEYYPWRFQEEMARLFEALGEGSGGTSGEGG